MPPLPYLNSFRKRQQLRTFYHFPISQMSREFEIPRALLPPIRIQTQNKVPYGLCIKNNLYNTGNIMLEASSPHQISSQSLILPHSPTYVMWPRNTSATYVMAFHGHPNVTLEAGSVSQLFKESPYFTLITFCHNDSFSSGNLQSHLHNNASKFVLLYSVQYDPKILGEKEFSATKLVITDKTRRKLSIHPNQTSKQRS